MARDAPDAPAMGDDRRDRPRSRQEMDAPVGHVAPVEPLVGIPNGAFDQAVSGRERLHDRAILPGAAAGVKRALGARAKSTHYRRRRGTVRLTPCRAGPTVAQATKSWRNQRAREQLSKTKWRGDGRSRVRWGRARHRA